jgi:hypothetical protein
LPVPRCGMHACPTLTSGSVRGNQELGSELLKRIRAISPQW